MSTGFVIVWLVAGFFAGIAFLTWARRFGIGHERRVYGIGLVVAALIYVGFAAFRGNAWWVGVELAGVVVCWLLWRVGRRVSFHFVAVGWLLHPLWDVALHLLGPGAGIPPAWYAVACVSFDVLVAFAIIRRVSAWRGTG